MSSICLSCVVFTLHDKALEENKYIDIFILWLSQLIKCGDLQKEDALYIFTDKRTIDYIHESTIFSTLKTKIVFQISVIVSPSPTTLLDGMMWKYTFFPYTQDIYMYCDIDIFIVNSLKDITSKMIPNHIYVSAEGFLKDPNYSADFPKDYPIDDTSAGLSAGKFAVYGKDAHTILCKTIQSLCKRETGYYTLEQPFFNHAILLKIPDTISCDVHLLHAPVVSFNGEDYEKGKTVLLDCAGEPGNGKVHYDFMIEVLCLLNSGYF